MLSTTKKLITKKLFYKKWMYKVVIKCGGIAQLRRRGLSYVMNLKPPTYGSPYMRDIASKVVQNRLSLCEIAEHLENHLALGDHQIRVESDTCSVFTNNRLIMNNILIDLEKYVTEYYEPENNESADFLSNNKNKVVCSQLPHEIFRYKLYFKNGEIKDHRVLQGFLSWADKMSDKIYVPAGVRKIIAGESYHPSFYGNYFYAKDKQMTSMALMMLSETLHRTEEYVLKSELI